MAFPPTYYVHAKAGQKNPAKFQRLHQSNILQLSDSMEPVEITVFNSKIGKDPEVAKHRIFAYELFKNQD